jgi:hypothetical protein
MADARKIEELLIAKRYGVRPEHVFFAGTEGVEPTAQRCRRVVMVAKHGGVGEDTQHAVFRQRTCRPTLVAICRKPIMRSLVVDVTRLKQRDEYVDVEQRDTAHGSSRRRLTSSIVSGGLPLGRRGSRGTPFRISTLSAGSSAFLARSDRTRPAVVPRFAAISFAACSTSSSTSSVVLIVMHHNITHQMRFHINTVAPRETPPRSRRARYVRRSRQA